MFIYFDLLVFFSFFFKVVPGGGFVMFVGFIGPRCRMAVGDLGRIRDWPSLALARGSWENRRGKGEEPPNKPRAGASGS